MGAGLVGPGGNALLQRRSDRRLERLPEEEPAL